MSNDKRNVDRRNLLKGVTASAAGSLAPTFPTSIGVAKADFADGPTGVHVAYGAPPQSSLRVGWTSDNVADAHVEYGPEGGDRSNCVAADATVIPDEELVAFDAKITRLQPATTYEYRVATDVSASPVFTVTTAPEDATNFRVTAVADNGIQDPDNPAQRAEGDAPEEVVARAWSFDPDFHLGVGDIAYANGYPYTWDTYFEAFEEFYAQKPFLTVPGNHEKEPGQGFSQYDARLNRLMPFNDPGLPNLESKQRGYDFRYGNVRFVGLNTSADACGDVARGEEFIPFQDTRCYTDEAYLYNERQRQYVRETLAAADSDPDVKWKVAYFHSSFWTDGDHDARKDLCDLWGPFFDEHDVDLVLSGHNHSYERSKTMRGDAVRETGTTFVINGTGGSGHYGFQHDEPPEWMAFRDADYYGVVGLDFTVERIHGQYVARDGTVVDSFRIEKTADGEPTQVSPGDATREPLAVSGSRSDVGSSHAPGATNSVELAGSADQPVRLRDEVPVEQAVSGASVAGTDRNDAPDGRMFVYFDAPPAKGATVVYDATAPTKSGTHTFGPLQVREVNGTGWVDVPGTVTDERVTGGSR